MKRFIVILTLVFSATAVVVGYLPSINTKAAEVTSNKKQIITHDPRRGKPGASVVLNYQAPGDMQIDQTTHIDVSLLSDTSQGQLTVYVSAGSGLKLLSSPEHVFELNGEALGFGVEVMALRDGLHYINLIVSEYSERTQRKQRRSFAIPVTVGSGAALKKAPVKTDRASGEKIIEMLVPSQ